MKNFKADAAGARAESRARDPRFAELDALIAPVDASLRRARLRQLKRQRQRRERYLTQTGRFEDLRKEGFR
jgi:hypothetical protein